MKKIAILAAFPLHLLKGFGKAFQPKGHYATWLPQVAEAWDGQEEVEIHWIVMSELVKERRYVCEWGQMFHVLPTSQSGRSATLFREDRKAIHAVLSEIQPDLVHGWGTEDVYGLAAVLSGRPNIVSMQGILSYYALKNRMPARTYLQAVLELFILWKAGRVTTESKWGRNVVLRRNPFAKVDLVEYGVQQVFFQIKWQPEEKTPFALFVGGISPRKGIQDLVESFRDPKLAGRELVVIGGGEGAWSENLQKSAPPNIRWLGRKSAEGTAEYMSKAWCLVLPTRADTSPNVVKEARVVGIPVITTRNGGQASYVQDGEDGYFVECGDIKGLVQKLRIVLGSLATTEQLGKVSQNKYRDLLTADQTANHFKGLYWKILSDKAL
ncbi:MAG: glycosyltransferase [Proteobacteria bacterium]|nr:glycosyltransferase [Pseudomonadota bacterium]NBS50082.1 glycosyltransferase [Verrucomicrobiota bacterium]NBS79650.1 glycosyltransferase [bacterium]